MSSDNKRYMAAGHRVRHKYKHKRGQHPVCTLCGVKRRKTTSGWEYRPIVSMDWLTNNPPCVRWTAVVDDEPEATSVAVSVTANDAGEGCREDNELRPVDELIVSNEQLYEAPTSASVRIVPGTLFRFTTRVLGALAESEYPVGSLWIWTRSDDENVLMQAIVAHVHRVHAVFWSPMLAGMVKMLIESGRAMPWSGSVILNSTSPQSSTPNLATYRMFRDAGILPLPTWHEVDKLHSRVPTFPFKKHEAQ